jgi:hypothetical protein
MQFVGRFFGNKIEQPCSFLPYLFAWKYVTLEVELVVPYLALKEDLFQFLFSQLYTCSVVTEQAEEARFAGSAKSRVQQTQPRQEPVKRSAVWLGMTQDLSDNCTCDSAVWVVSFDSWCVWIRAERQLSNVYSDFSRKWRNSTSNKPRPLPAHPFQFISHHRCYITWAIDSSL